ncbi:uncharacterized protein I303_108441 [Kwoniella dejecticola CBS 10117]|uniref:UPF3 domain-containing protein n=1 Tax=Kwoniella dejecticola CBS 10117 TaxID=1296121 RepID=A0A1A5ZXE4_9TREE|nr:uncharacterized protein I303_07234 [Kwoniella dejecticola CBS 10117]OBR82474.1 hypothetical protein I303_07234 [Kwoniella dejecticola CBS 10117]
MVAQVSAGASVRNKLIIRRLPPTLPEEIFWKSVAAWIDDNSCLWKRYIKGKAGDGSYDAHPVHSRAYVLMASPEALVDFVKGFDGHVYKAKTGAEYRVVVEFAPVQKTPYKAKVKVDARQGTIDEDPDYLSYMESLKAEPVKPALEVSTPVSQPTSTPLLDHLRSQGKSKKSKSSKSAASSSSANEGARRAAALASVTAAATKRAAQAGSGPVMVAGKGREVHISASTPESQTSAQGDGDGKKKGRNRKKGKKDGESTERSNATEVQGQPTQTKKPSAQAKASAQVAALKQETGRSTPSGVASPAGSKPDGGKQGGRGGGGSGKGGDRNVKLVEGDRTGGEAGGGRGKGKSRTGKAQVMEILTRNTAGPGGSTRGGRGGGATGSKPAVDPSRPVRPDTGASRARIDVP